MLFVLVCNLFNKCCNWLCLLFVRLLNNWFVRLFVFCVWWFVILWLWLFNCMMIMCLLWVLGLCLIKLLFFKWFNVVLIEFGWIFKILVILVLVKFVGVLVKICKIFIWLWLFWLLLWLLKWNCCVIVMMKVWFWNNFLKLLNKLWLLIVMNFCFFWFEWCLC